VRVIGRRAVRLYPLFHPAAALYTPRMLEVLRSDFQRIPELLALDPPPQPEAGETPELLVDPQEAPRAVPAVEPASERASGPPPPLDGQMDLF
jgi:hypothetical protein